MNPKWCVPIVSIAVGYKCENSFTQHGREHDSTDDVQIILQRWGARITFGAGDSGSLYHNAAFFFRFNLPFGVWFGIRWKDEPGKKSYFQGGIGFKLSGNLGANFRFQSDESAAEGTNGPNYGQATGWWDGPK